jgi:hypothetical protein
MQICIRWAFYLFLLQTLPSCSLLVLPMLSFQDESPQKAFKRGNYQETIKLCVRKLQSKPRHRTSSEILPQAYRLFMKQKQQEIAQQEARTDENKWESLTHLYQSVQETNEYIQRCPKAWELISEPVFYTQALEDAKRNTALVQYRKGMQLLSYGTHQKAREAYQHFNSAQQLFPNASPDLVAKIEEARQKGTVRIELLYTPLDINKMAYIVKDSYSQTNASWIANNLDKRVFLECAYTQVPQDDVDLIDDRVSFAYTTFLPEEKNYREREEIRTSTIKKDSTEEKISAKISFRERSQKASCKVEIMITEVETGNILFNEAIHVSHTWKTNWVIMLNGDTRALKAQERNELGKQPEDLPTYQVMFNKLQEKALSLVLEKLEAFYQ